MSKTANFCEILLENSVSTDIDKARKEWKIDHIYYEKHGQYCICGQANIHRVVVIRNTINNNTLEVGYTCYKEHIDKYALLDTDFSKLSFKSRLNDTLIRDGYIALTKEVMGQMCDSPRITVWEYDFMRSILNQTWISEKQYSILCRILSKWIRVRAIK